MDIQERNRQRKKSIFGAVGGEERWIAWREKPLVGMVGGEGVPAVERLQDPRDAANLPVVKLRPPLLPQRLQVLGRHPPPPSTRSTGMPKMRRGGALDQPPILATSSRRRTSQQLGLLSEGGDLVAPVTLSIRDMAALRSSRRQMV